MEDDAEALEEVPERDWKLVGLAGVPEEDTTQSAIFLSQLALLRN